MIFLMVIQLSFIIRKLLSVSHLLREVLSDRRAAGSRWNSFMIGFRNHTSILLAVVGSCGEAICEKSV